VGLGDVNQVNQTAGEDGQNQRLLHALYHIDAIAIAIAMTKPRHPHKI
jgi:hypothetical protein